MSKVASKSYDKVYGIFGVRKRPNTAPDEFFDNVELIEKTLNSLKEWHQGSLKLVLGGSRGVEMIAEQWAERNEIDFERIKPILHDGHISPFDVRNEKIIDKSTDILVWWDAEDPQIGRTLRIAVRRGKGVQIFPIVYDV